MQTYDLENGLAHWNHSAVSPKASSETSRRSACTFGLVVLVWVLMAEPAAGSPPQLSEAVPRDAVAAYFAVAPSDALGSSDSWSALRLAAFLADRANQTGLLSRLDEKARVWIDVASAVSVAFDYPHAVVLLDIAARPRKDGGHELAALRAAMIIRTRGDNDRIVERIQHLLSAYTNTEDGHLKKESGEGLSFFRLRDQRLADWAVITWGAYGEYYVVSIGDGAFEEIVSTIRNPEVSLSRDAWFQRAIELPSNSSASAGSTNSRDHNRDGKRGVNHAAEPNKKRSSASEVSPAFHPRVSWYTRFDRLRRDSDATFDAKVQWVQYSLGLAGVERGLWMAGQSPATGSIEMVSVVHAQSRDSVHWLAGDVIRNTLAPGVIPDQATGYAVVDCNPSAIWRGIAKAYFKAKSPTARERSESTMDRLEAAAGVSIERDIVSMLRGPIVIHNYPLHALRLPLAWTILVPIRAGGDAAGTEASVLRDRVDRLLSVVREETTCGGGMELVREPDGLWYIQYGLAGPAIAITDGWVVIGFSPHAVRMNVALLASRSGKRDATESEP